SASSLDAFSSYRLERGCPAMPFRTTGRLEAPSVCSSRIETLQLMKFWCYLIIFFSIIKYCRERTKY
ncbi:MAG: hypothetical protein ACTSRG_26135, partial [Candidatus Helarchaeota archaeon]